MLSRRVTLLAIAALGIAMAGFAQPAAPDLVEVGGYKAHPTRILARLARPEAFNDAATAADLKSVGLSVRRRFSLVPGGLVLELDSPVALQADGRPDARKQAASLLSRIELLRASGLFEYANPDWAVKSLLTEPTDAAYVNGLLWGLRNTGQDAGQVGADVITDPAGGITNAWDITTGSTNVVVAVIDTGIRYTHKDLERQMWRNPGEIPGNLVDDDGNGYVDDVFGVNTINGSGNPADDVGHGTHVAGTIGASANDLYQHVGVAWNVQLMAVKFLGPFGGFTSDAIESINYSVASGAKILNNSWGGGPGGTNNTLLEDAIIAASTNEVLFVVAAGNDYGNDNDAVPVFPASYSIENVISVAALDRKDELAVFSNYGARSVHVGAPGVEIFSCLNGSDTDYAVQQGTSMAAPHVSGIAALIWSAFPDASMAEVRERIIRSAVPVDALKDITVSGGRANAYAALNASPDGVLEVRIDPRDQSAVLLSTNLPVFVTVNDLFDVTNATVWAEFTATGDRIDFLNDGVPPDVTATNNVYSAAFDLTPFTDPAYSNIVDFVLNVTAPNKTDFSMPVTYYVVEPPPNDMFATPDKIPPLGAFGDGLVTATNTYATLELDEPVHAGVVERQRSLWWTWSPADSGVAIVDTAGSSFDALLAVYTGETIRTVAEVVSADVSDGKAQPYVTFAATKGRTYRIAVAGSGTNEFGQIRLRVQPGGSPDNRAPVVRITSPGSGQTFTTESIDVLGSAFDPEPSASGVKEILVRVNGGLPFPATGTDSWTAINLRLQQGENTIAAYGQDFAGNISAQQTVTVYYVPQDPANDVFGTVLSPSSPYYLKETAGADAVDNTHGTTESGEPQHGGNEGGRSVWWSWKAPESGVLELDTEGSDFDTLLGLYEGSRVDRLTTVASNDDARTGVRFSKISQAVRAGVEYRIAVDGFGGAFGNAVLNYAFASTNTLHVVVLAGSGGTTTPPPGAFDVVAGSTLTLRAVPEPFFEFAAWQGSINLPAENPISVAVDSNLELQPVFLPVVFSDDFETGDFSRLPWESSGDADWTITSEVVSLGQFAARSGDIGGNAASSLVLQSRFNEGVGRFDIRVSCEEDWDFLEFYLDDQRLEAWTGEVDWLRFEFPIAAGRHTLRWTYAKDTRGSAGLDAAFIDNVNLPLEVGIGPETPGLLSISELFDGRLEIKVEGQIGQTYVIQGTENLPARWRSLSTNVATQGEIRYIDAEGPVLPRRYYRAIVR
ncbi:MAG: S8 family serine peptidase [Verrucomicrobiales bacterium]|nr:S8 family serine peptidase [Verrucomicrobiales bacterium]MCP5527598.1 S8 family serine peptidase [Verrucomicrobiales bacterium]